MPCCANVLYQKSIMITNEEIKALKVIMTKLSVSSVYISSWYLYVKNNYNSARIEDYLAVECASWYYEQNGIIEKYEPQTLTQNRRMSAAYNGRKIINGNTGDSVVWIKIGEIGDAEIEKRYIDNNSVKITRAIEGMVWNANSILWKQKAENKIAMMELAKTIIQVKYLLLKMKWYQVNTPEYPKNHKEFVKIYNEMAEDKLSKVVEVENIIYKRSYEIVKDIGTTSATTRMALLIDMCHELGITVSNDWDRLQTEYGQIRINNNDLINNIVTVLRDNDWLYDIKGKTAYITLKDVIASSIILPIRKLTSRMSAIRIPKAEAFLIDNQVKYKLLKDKKFEDITLPDPSKLGFIESVDSHNGSLLFTTRPVYISKFYDYDTDSDVLAGRYVIEIKNWNITIKHKDKHDWYQHPHINSDGKLCIDEFGGAVDVHIKNRDLVWLLLTLYEFLETYNDWSPYEDIESWVISTRPYLEHYNLPMNRELTWFSNK